MDVPRQLSEIAGRVKDEGATPRRKVRTLLAWFGQKRRGRSVVNAIRTALHELGLETVPDFEGVFIDSEVQFRPKSEKASATPGEGIPASSRSDDEEAEVRSEDPVIRIGTLEAANRPPTSIDREANLTDAMTRMLVNEYSQLPVMQGTRTVHGMISWKSIGMARMQNERCERVRDCMGPAQVISADTPMIRAIDAVHEYGVVLVRSAHNEIQGLVTTTDLSHRYDELARPFLLLREIENQLHRLIERRFAVEELAAAKYADSDRTVESVADLTFGEYVRLLENGDNWTRLDLPLERRYFVERLEKVRRIRNDVMHFSTDPPDEEDLRCLGNMARVLRDIG